MSMKNIGGGGSTSELSAIQEGDVQPNAVDLRIGKIFRISNKTFEVDNENKVHRGSDPCELNRHGIFNLPEGHYEVIMENKIKVGAGEAGFVITRSTLNRNGVFLTSGLYDSGYDEEFKIWKEKTIYIRWNL